MKRRNADCGKIRRPIKRNKITEGMCGSTTFLYLKYLILWAVVITADFMFMFRFEFLWPFCLLLRSVHDSFKYKGLACSVLFVCIAITSDLVCLFFIPVHWLLFAASTYVWVQYVWHTDKGICLPTIILWMLFIYLEAGIRWKDSRHMPHLDLCRPFAAHCIGYPVVTLGFGFKSYVGYRMRQRKQREVAKENEFYMQLLQQALPQEENVDEISTSNCNLTVSSSSAVQLTTHTAVQTTVTATTTTTTTTVDHQINNISGVHHNEGIFVQTSSQAHIQQQQQHQHQQTSTNNNYNNNLNHLHNSNSSNSNNNKNAQTHLKFNNNNNLNNSILTSTSNGHVGNNISKNRRDKELTNNLHNFSSANRLNDINHHVSNSTKSSSNSYYNQINNNLSANHISKDSNQSKEKDCYENNSSSSSSLSSTSNSSAKENHQVNGNVHNSNEAKKSQQNGNVYHLENEEIAVEKTETEKVKNRKNRSKKDLNASSSTSSKDNHHNNHNNHQQNSSSSTSHNHAKEGASDSSSSLSSASSSTSQTTLSNIASQIVTKICESCLRLEAEIKKYRTEVNHMKQIENELRQKLDANATTKSCLQAKQKELDELEKRLQELNNMRQMDVINIQNIERRLLEERRQKQSLESQLNNEKKARKLAEDKAARPECSEACKQRKQQIESEAKQLRRELKAVEEAKQAAEQQGRKCEQELRMFEAEVRNREAQQGTEVLISALAAMQDKNSTLEKNLSAETRVKLDLFSALGEAKRQLEIKDSLLRNKEDEILDLKAKIAQLLAVMPTDTLCMPSCSSAGSSMLRMNETQPLQGPSSPLMGLGSSHQQMIASHQLSQQRAGPSSVVISTSSNCITNVSAPSSVGGGGAVGLSSVLSQTPSNLDPNATAYTPKNSSMIGSAEA